MKVKYQLLTLIIVSSFLLVIQSYGQTYISGEVSGTWTKESSPYVATADLVVEDSTQLLIEPGVQVLFKGNYELLVEGQLEAVGAEEDLIVFSKNNGYDFWAGLRFNESDSLSTLEFCKVEHGKADGSHGDGSSVERSGGGIYIYNSKIQIKNCVISNNSADVYGGGIYGSPVLIENSEIKNNTANSNGGGIYTSGNNKIAIANCVFESNSGHNGGAIHNDAQIIIAGSKFIHNSAGNTGGAVSTLDYLITNSLFIDNNASYGSAVWLRSDGQVNNSIFYDRYKRNRSFAPHFDYHVIVKNSIFKNISFYNQYGDLENLKLEYCNLDNSWDGVGNIFTDPGFVDPTNGDFHLQANSPCVDAGHPSVIYNDADGSRNDMGIYGGSGLAVNPTTIDFGSLGYGQTRQELFTFYNFSEDDFVIQSAEPMDMENFAVTVNFPLTIPSMTSDTLAVEFHPHTSGEIQSQIQITSADFNGAQHAYLDISGIGGVFTGEVSGTWTRENSPYIIGDDVTVPENKTLTIEPGVIVYIDTTYGNSRINMLVRGSLIADGSESDSILFVPMPGQERKGVWEGIQFDPPYDQGANMSAGQRDKIKQDISEAQRNDIEQHRAILNSSSQSGSMEAAGNSNLFTLRYCRISYARTGVVLEKSEAEISNCTFSNNSEYGVKWQGIDRDASGILANCSIFNNDKFGVYCYAECFNHYAHASPQINGNKITENGDGGIYLYADGGSPSSWTWPGGTWDECHVAPKIENNVIAHNDGAAIECSSWGATATGYLSTHKSAAYTEPEISQNLIYGNQSGIYTKSHLSGEYVLSFSDVIMDRNTFYDNPENQLHASDSTSQITAVNSIFWNYSGNSVTVENDARITAHYNCFQTAVDDTGNISSDPHFADAFNDDFSLLYTSPCIDAGDLNSPKDADSTRADIGAKYYHQSIAAFSLQAPANDTTIANQLPEFAWNPAVTVGGDPIVYHLYYSKNESFVDSVTVEVANIETNTYTVQDSLTDGQSYYWKVLAKNKWNLEKWSDATWRFSVNTDTFPPVFADSLPVLQFNEDENLSLPLDFWHDYVEDAHCPDSTLDFEMQPGSHLKILGDDTGLSIFAESDWFGIDSLKLTVTDKSNLSATAYLEVWVQPVNDPPVISALPDSIFFRADSEYNLNVAEHVSDIDTPDSLISYIFQSENDSIICTPDDEIKGVVTLRAINGFAGRSVLNIAVYDTSDTTHAEISVQVAYPTGMNIFSNAIPTNFQLYQNFPNPFNPRTLIPFSLPEESEVKITIYNINGKVVEELFNGKKQPGNHILIWDANNFSSGTYFIRFETPEMNLTKKCLLMK